ncbi:hypothetical protein LOTGIDRAFT_168234 [Lottia gigantea]|uniref:DUF4795 domain-containing protein n=1 Tax=Lottia gigantea TaxID=225164 RepID=V3ZR17_LOTGI|nr:hypothetical protein LOTGIDRAFT_168234 [Lottia gigantea]ESO84975.1 hypothetical protein LOTGIDRAFT_168234 [Lottia gigantea]
MVSITLSRLLDLAIGSPEVGAVNFNVLYRLLKAMINKLDLKDFEIEFSDFERDALGGTKLLALEENKHESPYHQLEQKVSIVFNQMEQLNALPSTKQLTDQVLDKGDNERPLSYMWQYMQLKKKVETNEEGIEKLMSMVSDLMKQIDNLLSSNTGILNRLGDLDLQALNEKIGDLHNSVNNLNVRLDRLPPAEDMNNFVTWSYLEDALNGFYRAKTSTSVENICGYYDDLIKKTPEERNEFIEDLIKKGSVHQYLPKLDDEVLKMSPEERKSYIEESIKNDSFKDLFPQSGTDMLKMNEQERENFVEDATNWGTIRQYLPGLEKNFETEDLAVRVKTIEDAIKEGLFHKFFPCRFQYLNEMTHNQKKVSIEVALRKGTLDGYLPGVGLIDNPVEFADKAASTGIIEAYQSFTGSEPPPVSNLEKDIEKEIIKECQMLMYKDNGLKETDFAKESYVESPVAEPGKDVKEQESYYDSRRTVSPRSRPLSARPKSKVPSGKTRSRPPTGRPASSHSSPGYVYSTISMGPSPDLVDVLERLGSIYDQHNRLVGWVKNLKEHLQNKAENLDLQQLEQRVMNLEDLMKKGDLSELSKLMELMQREIEEIKQLINNLKSGGALDKASLPQSVQIASKASLPDIGQIVENRISDSVAFTDLLEKISGLENKIAGFQESLNGRGSVMSSDVLNTLTVLQDSMSELSSDMEEGKKRRREKSSKIIPVADEEKRSETPQFDEDERFANVVEGSVTYDVMNMLGETMPEDCNDQGTRLKRLGLILDNQLGEVKDRIENVDEDLALMAKAVEVALDRVKNAEIEQLKSVSNASTNKTPGFVSNVDNEALLETQQTIRQLQEEIGKLNATTGEIINVNIQRQMQIEQLYENKADKEYVLGEFDVKADKRQLESKVNYSLFNKTTDEINKTIREFENKLEGNETEMQNIFHQLTEDVDGKIDKMEMDPLKGWVDSRIRELNKKIAKSQPGWTDDDAAGLRKQLIQRFQCLSCDKTIHMTSKNPVASLPLPSSMPTTRSARPYTIFELDQIRLKASKGIISQSIMNFERALMERQLARIRKSDLKAFLYHYSSELEALGMHKEVALAGQSATDSYARTRACGGLHTMTFPHRRTIRIANMPSIHGGEKRPKDVPRCTQQCGEESDVQGADGIIYKGRCGYSEAGHGPKGTKAIRKVIPPSTSQPLPASSSRPVSARNRGQRPASARSGSRPTSARPNTVQAIREEDSVPVNRPNTPDKNTN